MISCVREKFRVTVSLFKARKDKSEVTIHLSRNSEFSKSSESSLWPAFNCNSNVIRFTLLQLSIGKRRERSSDLTHGYRMFLLLKS